MDEEKNKLDAFCEQSLKNVSAHDLASIQFEYTIHLIFNECLRLSGERPENLIKNLK